jgi:hypothetical protein
MQPDKILDLARDERRLGPIAPGLAPDGAGNTPGKTTRCSLELRLPSSALLAAGEIPGSQLAGSCAAGASAVPCDCACTMKLDAI